MTRYVRENIENVLSYLFILNEKCSFLCNEIVYEIKKTSDFIQDNSEEDYLILNEDIRLKLVDLMDKLLFILKDKVYLFHEEPGYFEITETCFWISKVIKLPSGIVLSYSELSNCAKKAIHEHYDRHYGPNCFIKSKSDLLSRKFVYIEIETEKFTNIISGQLDSCYDNKYADFAAYHKDYISAGEIYGMDYPAFKEIWPIILSNDEYFFTDGVRRLHSYVYCGVNMIPCVSVI